MTDNERLEHIKERIEDIFEFSTEQYLLARHNNTDDCDELYGVYRANLNILSNVLHVPDDEINGIIKDATICAALTQTTNEIEEHHKLKATKAKDDE